MTEYLMEEAKDMDGVYHYIKRARIVRCLNCKHYVEIQPPIPVRVCEKLGVKTFPDDFCSYGERRTDGNS